MKAHLEGPIFLVGCPRSGTTLIQRMLDAHSAVAIAPETHFIRRFWLKRRRYGDLTRDNKFQSLIDDIVGMPEFAEMGLDARAFREAAWCGARDYHTLFRLLLCLFAEARQVSIVGEKTPNHLLYMPTLERFFPAARFVHIVRDPRAVINSWKHVPWSTGSLAGDAMVWRRYMATARRRPPRRPSRMLVIRYEHLVSEPERTMDTVCRFMGVEYEPTVCSFNEGESETFNVSREPWKISATRPIDPSRLNRWRKELSPPMVARIEAVVWLEMKRLGYSPQTTLSRRLAVGAYAWPLETIRLAGRVVRRLVT